MTELRPADLALFLLASGEMLPRKRARDQQADLAGLAMKRRVLDMLVSRDPEPAELNVCLAQIVEEFGPPTGPTRAICASVQEEWEMAVTNPGLLDWLVEEAVRHGSDTAEGRGGRRRRRPDA